MPTDTGHHNRVRTNQGGQEPEHELDAGTLPGSSYAGTRPRADDSGVGTPRVAFSTSVTSGDATVQATSPDTTKPKQRTVVRYIVKKCDDHVHREAGPTCPGSDVSDTAPSGGATPRGQSPAREDGAGASQSVPLDEGSTDEAEASHAPPMPYYQGAAAFVSTLNIYQHVRLADIARADTIEMTPLGEGVVISLTWPMESTIDMNTDKEPSDVPQRDNTAGYNWRTDLTDNV